MSETCTLAEVLHHSTEWCARHPSWVRICDTPEGYSDSLHIQWSELSATQQKRWGSELAYDEFAVKRCKVPYGFVSGRGEFYERVADVPPFHNLMMVFRVGVKVANEMRVARAAAAEASSRPNTGNGDSLGICL